MEFDEKQTEAMQRCIDTSTRVAAVTGPAGSGKTTIIRQVYDAMTQAGYRVVLCAPTGKAAKRIKEATGIPAMTMHRLLEYTHPGEPHPETGEPAGISEPTRTRRRPLEYDVVLADEYAMVSHELHRNLFDALPTGGMVRVFGDANQLPPIEKYKSTAGTDTPFQTLLRKFDGVFLSKIYRQGEGSSIIENANKISVGAMPKKSDEFHMIVTDQPMEMLRKAIERYAERGIDFRKIENQVISPGVKTWTGTLRVNAFMQNILRPEVDGWIDLPRHTWIKEPARARVGDKVIITQNVYDLREEHDRFVENEDGFLTYVEPDDNFEVFNGETGIIVDIYGDRDHEYIQIDLGDRVILFPPLLPHFKGGKKVGYYDPRKSLDLAYCVTTHKMQGSECDVVIYLLNKSQLFNQHRKNFYTAVTRARKEVMVIVDQKSLWKSLKESSR